MAANAIAMFNVSFFSAFLPLEFTDVYGVKDEDMGYYYSILSLSYLTSALTIPIIFRKVPRKLQFVCCYAFTSIALLFMGPSKLFRFP